jgi:hypothetical protein
MQKRSARGRYSNEGYLLTSQGARLAVSVDVVEKLSMASRHRNLRKRKTKSSQIDRILLKARGR